MSSASAAAASAASGAKVSGNELDHVKISVVTTCGDFKTVAEKVDEIEPECQQAVKKNRAASKTLEEAKKAYENAKQEAEVAVVKEKELTQLMQKLVDEKEAVSKRVAEVENVALSLISKEELFKLKSDKNVVYSRWKIDETSLHDGMAIGPGNLLTQVSGDCVWTAVRTTLPLSSSCRRFAVRVVHRSRRSDDGGLVIGLLPHAAYAFSLSTFIGGLGGWSLNCNGNCYGNWKADNNKMPFGAGDVVKFEVDTSSKTVRIECGGKSTVARITGAFGDYEELFPAVGMFYAGDKAELLEEFPEN